MDLQQAHQRVIDDLLAARNEAGHWEGRLASSALSTATAISAFSLLRQYHQPDFDTDALIHGGIQWLIPKQNSDGGWGDTDKSYSNISTTMLVEAALNLAGVADRYATEIGHAQQYIVSKGGVDGLRKRYGKDKTFAVPILTNCALAGLADWQAVSPLPFELACLPQSFYRFVKLPVVSYAIPALVAVGQVIHAKRRSWNPLTKVIRNASIRPSLEVLRRMQPASGGYLEAIPLTSFVAMSLIGAGHGDHDVVRNSIRFLVDTVREDGSWPIDTNLATWTTTLAVNALATPEYHPVEQSTPEMTPEQTPEQTPKRLSEVSAACWQWIGDCQNTERHPFTGADPGGWGWSDLSGAVPDADDTPGALLALRHWLARGGDPTKCKQQASAGVAWLLGLQNRDGGWPTFCRGWGTLPFDRSGSDLTAHAIRALLAWQDDVPQDVTLAINRGFEYLDGQQRADGSWYPLWFGNQDHPAEENPIYGTGKVLLAYRDVGRLDDKPARRGLDWLVDQQLDDGGWNSGFCTESPAESRQSVETAKKTPFSLVEETALAVEALLSDNAPQSQYAAGRGVDWLIEAVRQGRHLDPAPIGFYFAKLWYYEDLYPLLFTAAALGSAVQATASPAEVTA